MLSRMYNDLISVLKDYKTTRELWIALKLKFGETSATRLHTLTLKFDSHRMCPNWNMKQHLRQMSSIIRELKVAENNLSDEQQVQDGIRSLPNTWEQMRLNMTQNENIKTFDNLSGHLELEAERLKTAKLNGSSYITQSGLRRPCRPKHKKNQSRKNRTPRPAPEKTNSTKHKRGKHDGKNGKTSTTCFNRDKKGCFTRDCIEPKNVIPNLSSCFIFITSHVMVAHPSSDWIVDSGATKHVARDRIGFVEYRQIPSGSKVLYKRNDYSMDMLGIGTNKL